jgi:two-component sensor histidine kinase
MATSALPLAAAAPAERASPFARARPWLLGFLVWTLLALLVVMQNAVYARSVGQPVEWRSLLLGRLADWYTCAVFTPAYFRLVRRWPVDRAHWRSAVPVHLVATSIFVVLKFAMFVPLINAIRPGRDWTLGDTLAGSFVSETFAFWCLLGIVQAVEFNRHLREREVQAARLAAQLTEARLEALAAQLHPHFLFNTLQGVSTLLHRDPVAADRMLARLSELLRRTLRADGAHEVPLHQELELLDLYLGIVQTRFEDRLTLRRAVAPGLDEGLVPHMVLQPLVENALEHGIARRGGTGRVEIGAEREGDSLVLWVGDDGPGLGGARGFPRDGVGLSNTRRRLAQLYGDAARLDLAPAPDGGLRVTVRLPWHTTPATGAVA